MSTDEMYRQAPVGATTVVFGPGIRIVPIFTLNPKTFITASTAEVLAHAQAMRELAALSFDPDSLDRDLEDEINRNAWGIREA